MNEMKKNFIRQYMEIAYIASLGTIDQFDIDGEYERSELFDSEWDYSATLNSGNRVFERAEQLSNLEMILLAEKCEAVPDEPAIELWIEKYIRLLEDEGEISREDHSKNVNTLREELSKDNFDVIPKGESYARYLRNCAWGISSKDAYTVLEDAIEWLANVGADDECGMLETLRQGVPYDDVFPTKYSQLKL